MNTTPIVTTIADVFGIAASAVTEETGQDNLPEWDSVGHLRLVLQLEEQFGIRFDIDEIHTLTNVKGIAAALKSKGVL